MGSTGRPPHTWLLAHRSLISPSTCYNCPLHPLTSKKEGVQVPFAGLPADEKSMLPASRSNTSGHGCQKLRLAKNRGLGGVGVAGSDHSPSSRTTRPEPPCTVDSYRLPQQFHLSTSPTLSIGGNNPKMPHGPSPPTFPLLGSAHSLLPLPLPLPTGAERGKWISVVHSVR